MSHVTIWRERDGFFDGSMFSRRMHATKPQINPEQAMGIVF